LVKELYVENLNPRCLPGLTFPDFDLAPKREVWLLRTGFGIAPVNKLVSLTWRLWTLRSFLSFTLHYTPSVICDCPWP